MRSAANAMPRGQGARWRPGHVLTVIALGLTVCALAAAGDARGAEGVGAIGTFGSDAGQLFEPLSVAVDQSNGAVHVGDNVNERIDEFNASGSFIRAFGWGVVDGSGELQTCTTSCQAGIEGSGAGQLASPRGVAVESSTHDVYVIDRLNHRVQKFNSEGNFILMFGGHVDQTTGGNVCTAASGDTCQAGTTGTADGEFETWPGGGISSYIAVGPGGVVYVGDQARVQELEPDGSWKASVSLASLSPSGRVTALAVDSAGSIFLADEGVSGVRELELSGGSYVESPTQFDVGSTDVRAIALGSAGEVFVLDAGGGYHVLEYEASGAQTARFGDGVAEASFGMAFDEAGERLLVSDAQAGEVKALPLPSPGPLLLAGSGYRTEPTTTAMTVHAVVNPEGAPTTFRVEYGTTTAYGATTAESAVGEGFEGINVSVRLTGLAPGTTYHYRFVATNANGVAYGPDETLTTYAIGQFALPDGRAFEQVSPPQKESAEVGVPGNAGGGTDLSEQPLQASADGEAISYASFTSFGEAESAPAASQYLSRRTGGGWSTQNLSPPDREGYTRDPLRGFSPDLAQAAVIQREPPLTPDAPEGFENLYLRDNLTGALQAVTAVTPRVAPGSEYCVAFAGGSAGFGHVLFYATGALTPDAPEAPGRSLYEWSQGGGLKLVSVLPGGTPADPGLPSSGFGTGEGLLGCSQIGRPILRHAISEDASRIFWSKGGELFAREDGTQTLKLGDGNFWAASADGSRAFFTDNGSLFEYDLESEELTDLTHVPPGLPVEVQGVLGASDDGTYVYFAAHGVLVEGATRNQPNIYLWHEDAATHEAAITFVATAEGGDNWSNTLDQTARVTPDGRHLAFVSPTSLVGNHTGDANSGDPDSQVYLYDAPGGRLVCASCNPTGAAPVGASSVLAWTVPYQQPRYLSDDGGRLFFQSRDALSLHDTNGRLDVYMWERQGLGGCSAASAEFSPGSGGCVFPITSGRSGDDSYLLDASSDGANVFVSTREALVPADEDERYDVYDARVGGGFPPPPLPAAPCTGESCRPAVAAPQLVAPGSAGFFGEGNLHRHRCRARHHHEKTSRHIKHAAGQASRRARRCRHKHRGAGR